MPGPAEVLRRSIGGEIDETETLALAGTKNERQVDDIVLPRESSTIEFGNHIGLGQAHRQISDHERR